MAARRSYGTGSLYTTNGRFFVYYTTQANQPPGRRTPWAAT